MRPIVGSSLTLFSAVLKNAINSHRLSRHTWQTLYAFNRPEAVFGGFGVSAGSAEVGRPSHFARRLRSAPKTCTNIRPTLIYIDTTSRGDLSRRGDQRRFRKGPRDLAPPSHVRIGARGVRESRDPRRIEKHRAVAVGRVASRSFAQLAHLAFGNLSQKTTE